MLNLGVLLGYAVLQIAPPEDRALPRVAPEPEWVVAVDPASAPETSQAPTTFLLADQQTRLDRGRKIIFFRNVMRINTPDGLAAGNIALDWNPDTDVLTIHRVLIRRGSQRTDVLGDGQGFTVLRRETNLQNAVLDGVLTATMQPAGLEVGDILEVAGSITSSDPVMGAHVEQLMPLWNGVPVARGHMRLQWPATLPMQVRAAGEIKLPATVVRDGLKIIDLTRDGAAPVMPPANAPPRFALGRFVQATDFASWADLAATVAPLYDVTNAPAKGSPIDAEIARIRDASTDPVVRAQAALTLAQDKIRYVALMMNGGGYRPATVAETWSRRFADCKGKTLLLLTLLHALDIEAEAVLVSTGFGDGLDRQLPMVGLFDHVLVRATIAGKPYWLDGTRVGDTDIRRLATPFFHWGLPLQARGAALVRMVPAPPTRPSSDTSIAIDATAGLKQPATFTVETILRDDEAIGVNASLGALDASRRETALRAYWKRRYDFVQPATVANTFDRATGEVRLTMRGTTTIDWKQSYQVDGMSLGYKADFAREPGADRDAPFAIPYPFFNRTVETITFPPYSNISDGAVKTDETLAGIEYKRTSSRTRNGLRFEASTRSVVPEIPAKVAADAQVRLREFADIGTIATVGSFRESDVGKREDVAAALKADPKDVQALDELATLQANDGDIDGALATYARIATPDAWQENRWVSALIRKRDYKGALARLDSAIARLPNDANLRSSRGEVLLSMGRRAEAVLEAERVAKLPDGRTTAASLYLSLKMPAEAVRQYDLAIAAGGEYMEYQYFSRAIARPESDIDGRMADFDAALKIDPSFISAITGKVDLLQKQGKADLAKAVLDDALTRSPTDDDLLIARSAWFQKAGDRTAALRDLATARADAIERYSFMRLCAHGAEAKLDLELALADCDEAAIYVPGDIAADRAKVLVAMGRYPEAIVSYDRSLRYAPDFADVVRGRAEAKRKSGDLAGYKKDVEEADRLMKEGNI